MNETFMQSGEELHQDHILVKEWQLNEMSGCMETLVTDQKRAIELFYLQQKCYNEITELTGFDWNKVRSLIQNGKRNLKICMENALKTGYHNNG
jgi:RNA polymerase sigma-70 factor (ECF subfamily)